MKWHVTDAQQARWEMGNEDEKSFWLGLTEEDFLAHEQGYRALAGQMLTRIQNRGFPADFRALQIGCAVEDTIFFLEGGRRYAIDPLADFYKTHFERTRNPNVDYRVGVGEKIPYEDDFFDVVICQNLLDHVANYHVVLEEIKRVARSPNLFYFGTDVYPEEAARSRWARDEQGEIYDVQHPHTFTIATLEDTLAQHGFQIVERYPVQPAGKADESVRHCLYAVIP